jgi:hypothetical protein
MTEHTTPRPGLRFTKDFQFFDHARTHMMRSWHRGDVVSDEKDIAWLVGIAAPVEEAIIGDEND